MSVLTTCSSVASAHASALTPPPELVGRQHELSVSRQALTTPPAVLWVVGEAGVGKSRLIHEALRGSPRGGARLLRGRCRAGGTPVPYGPVVELLRALAGEPTNRLSPVCGVLRPLVPELSAQLPPGPECSPDPRVLDHQILRATGAVLESVGETVVVLEDLQWADESTLAVLRFLVDQPPPGMSLVLSYREEELPYPALPLGRACRAAECLRETRVVLSPLTVAEVGTYYTAFTGLPGSTELAAALHRLTAGIPFAVSQYLHTLPAEVLGAGLDTAALAEVPVPTGLREQYADRLRTLPPGAAALVRAASILGRPASPELLAEVAQGSADDGDTEDGDADSDAGDGRGARALHEAVRTGALCECRPDRPGRYALRHPLAEQAVRSTLTGSERTRLHLGAVHALAGADPRPLTELAYHARESGSSSQWRQYAEAAASHAQETGEPALAVALWEDLLSCAELGGADRARIAVELSRNATLGRSHRRTCELLREVAKDRRIAAETRGEIRLNLGLLLQNQAAMHDDARADTEMAVAELRDRPALAARGMASLAMPQWGDLPYRVYQQWITEAERLVARQPDLALRTAVRGNHLALRMADGDPTVWEPAQQLIAQAGHDTDQHQLARSCSNFADMAAWIGHWASARRFQATGRGLADSCGASYVVGLMEGTALRLQWHTGNWQGLAESSRRTLESAEGLSNITADAHLVLGLLATTCGEWTEAVRQLDAAGLADPGNAPAPVLATAAGAMVRVQAAQGRLADARVQALAGLDLVRRKEMWAWAGGLLPEAVAVLARCAEARHAAAVTAEFARGIAGRDAPLAFAALQACEGIVALARQRGVEAAENFTDAAVAYRRLPDPYAATRATEAAVRCRGLASGSSPTQSELTALVAEFSALGATRDAARCRRLVRATGARMPSRRGRRGYGDQLSPREREVARLLALGQTNREIAAVLFLSPRTVEQHVARVLRKCGVRTRAELALPGRPDGGG